MHVSDFELLTVIGRGAFGEVRLCRRKEDASQTVYALKTLRKEVMIRRKQVQHVRAERDLMVDVRNNQQQQLCQWVVQLHWSFQDDEHLYFVMEYCPGGDMMGWLLKYDVFEESVARFYLAELVLAVQALHQMGYVHRDLKPDNILLDRQGHVKLTDFGLCKQAPNVIGDESVSDPTPLLSSADASADKRSGWQRVRRQRHLFYSMVGSPGYIAPEVILKQGYGLQVDWWGVGIILYEMLCGYPPFYSDDVAHTGQKIARFEEFLEFPKGSEALSPAAVDLIQCLLTNQRDRYSFEQIVSHRFFAGIDWTTIRQQPAPLQIHLTSILDTRYFEVPPASPATKPPPPQRQGPDPNPPAAADSKYLFYGFTSKWDQRNLNSQSALKRSARPPIPSFEAEEEEEEAST